jgi:hypothetical protein
MAAQKYTPTDEPEKSSGADKVKEQINAIIGFFKISSFGEALDKIVYILGALIGLGLVVMIGAMIGWGVLVGLLLVALALWALQLAWLFYFR